MAGGNLVRTSFGGAFDVAARLPRRCRAGGETATVVLRPGTKNRVVRAEGGAALVLNVQVCATSRRR